MLTSGLSVWRALWFCSKLSETHQVISMVVRMQRFGSISLCILVPGLLLATASVKLYMYIKDFCKNRATVQ